MIPLRDTSPTRHYPVVNYALIIACILVYIYQQSVPDNMARFFYVYGLVPARYTTGQMAQYFTPGQQVFSLISFMFLHGGFWHLLGNMWSLYIFGDNVEERLGSLRYLVFYLLCGICSGLCHVLLNLHANIPTIGASGAIAGVMGAYLVLFPHARILTLVPVFIIPFFLEIPAFVFLGIWFFIQFLSAAGEHGGNIAWWAHIGGFVVGLLMWRLFDKMPGVGFSRQIDKVTERKKTQMFQVLKKDRADAALDIHGQLLISPYEAIAGTHKVVSVPAGFGRRSLRVTVPAGMQRGKVLRLQGQGRESVEGRRGDLLLKIDIS